MPKLKHREFEWKAETIGMKEVKRRMKAAGPKVIERYKENGVIVKVYEAR